jgi:hypothetical protein
MATLSAVSGAKGEWQVLLRPALGPDLVEAAAAVDRSIIPRHKRHGGLSPTLRANHRVHLTGIAPCALATPGGTASRASLWLVHEPLFCKELLLTHGEHEFLPAVAALQGLVRKAHFSLTPFTCGEVWSQFSRLIRLRDALPRNQDQGPPGRDA